MPKNYTSYGKMGRKSKMGKRKKMGGGFKGNAMSKSNMMRGRTASSMRRTPLGKV